MADILIVMHNEIDLLHNLIYGGILAMLAFALVTGVLYTLAHQMNRAIRIHNLIRDTKQLRAEYMAYRNRHDKKE